MTDAAPAYPCPCCGYFVFEESPESYNICPWLYPPKLLAVDTLHTYPRSSAADTATCNAQR